MALPGSGPPRACSWRGARRPATNKIFSFKFFASIASPVHRVGGESLPARRVGAAADTPRFHRVDGLLRRFPVEAVEISVTRFVVGVLRQRHSSLSFFLSFVL